MAKRRKAGKDATSGGAAVEEVEDANSTPAGASFKVPEFTNARAQEIAAQGYRIAHEIDLLIRKEERHVKIVTKLREDRKSRNRDLIRLYEDERAGQTTLDLEAPAPQKPATTAKRLATTAGDYALCVVEVAPESWAALVNGRTVGEGSASAQDAQDVIRAELAMDVDAFAALTWEEPKVEKETAAVPPAPPPTPTGPVLVAIVDVPNDGFTLRHECRVEEFGDSWKATLDGTVSELLASKAKAQRWCFKEIERLHEGVEIPKLLWSTEPVFGDGMGVEYTAKVGRKTCVLRQAEPGKWTGRMGGVPVAIELPLADAKATCEAELHKGKPDAAIEWVRTETA